MLFEKEKYYKYIKDLENVINFAYVIFILLFGIIGLAMGKAIGLIIGILIGILLAGSYTLNTKIKIQKMKWEIDIYDKVKKI